MAELNWSVVSILIAVVTGYGAVILLAVKLLFEGQRKRADDSVKLIFESHREPMDEKFDSLEKTAI